MKKTKDIKSILPGENCGTIISVYGLERFNIVNFVQRFLLWKKQKAITYYNSRDTILVHVHLFFLESCTV